MLSHKLRPNIDCAPWVIDEVKKMETSTRICNGNFIISEAKSISSIIHKYMEFTDENNNTICIPTKTIIRLYSILEAELNRKNKTVDEFYDELT